MLIQISAGQGKGVKECERGCYLLYKELLNEFSLTIISKVESSKKCLKSAVFYTNEDLSYLEGTVQWICQSPFRANHKRKNWFIDISVLEEEQVNDNKADVCFEIFRSKGKGGQNVNKVSTAVRAIHLATGLTAVSMDQRTQLQNKKIAYLRLIQKIEDNQKRLNQSIRQTNWNRHNQIVRGNPQRIYKGLNFKRIQ